MQKPNPPGVAGILWRSILTGIGYVLLVIIGGGFARLVGLSAPIMPSMSSDVSQFQSLLILFLSGVLIGLIFGPLSVKLPLSQGWRVGILFFITFGINSVLILVEGLFFTTTPLQGHLYNLVSSAISWAGMSVLLTILFRSRDIEWSFGAILREALTQRSWISNLWRFLLAGFLYLPIFLIFGILIQPFVSIYYEDPSYGINQLFSIPAAEIIFPLELVRGYLFVIFVYPLIAILGREMSRWRQMFWIALILASLSGWLPMLVAGFLPLQFRLFHGLELTFDAIVHSIVIVWLLGFEITKDKQRTDTASVRKVST
jgi:hypothetical protein